MSKAGPRWEGLSGVVLTGGQSQRMGRRKAFMQLDGQTLISRVLDKLSRLCNELIVSTNDVEPYQDLPVRVVPDVIRGRGALSGIHASLAAMRNERALVVAVDMPFLSLSLLRFMAAVSPGYDVVVPRMGEYYEPLHAVYSVDCLASIEQLVASGPQRIVSLYQRVRVREVTEGQVRLFGAELSFFNLNTPDDWAEAQRLSAVRL
jgi:molybdopterin-guanine dinucleotide biosynthesis protein A